MSFKRTFLGVLFTTGLLSLGTPALMGSSLNPPELRQGVTVLTYAPPSLFQDSYVTANSNDRDRPVSKYLVPQESASSEDSLTPTQSAWVPSPMPDNGRDRGGHNN